MKYAMDFALLGRTISGIRWDEEKEEKFSLVSLRERLEFLERLNLGDEVFLVSGGLSDELAKRAARRGVKVNLIPGARLKEKLEGKEAVYLTLKRLSQQEPKLFNVWMPEEAEILSLTLTLEEWLETMERRKAAANQIRQDFYREVLRNPQRYQDLSIANLKEASEHRIEENPHYQWLLEREEGLEKEIKKVITGLDLYQKVFTGLDGCGPLIAARIIVYVRRIDRFPKWESLASYAGFGLKNGKKQRRRKGESLGYHPKLKSTLQYLWINNQLRRWKRGELSEILTQRILQEMKEKKPGTPTGRAIWWLGRKLVRKIYYRWRAFERGELTAH